MSTHKTQSDKKKLVDFSRIEKFHPYKTFLFFALLGSTVVFMAVTFLFILSLSRTVPLENFNLPKPFFLSTLLLLFSSYSVSKTLKAFNKDLPRNLLLYLGMTLLSGLVFASLQLVSWKMLFDSGFMLASHTRISYLYLISGIHFLHVLLGLVFLSTIFVTVFRRSGDAVKSLLYFSDQFQKTKIELAVIFWHFVDFLWLGLFLIFLFAF
ncbi:MAG: cytochrome c oxidase subunit 3 [Bacteroidia bacterium]